MTPRDDIEWEPLPDAIRDALAPGKPLRADALRVMDSGSLFRHRIVLPVAVWSENHGSIYPELWAVRLPREPALLVSESRAVRLDDDIGGKGAVLLTDVAIRSPRMPGAGRRWRSEDDSLDDLPSPAEAKAAGWHPLVLPTITAVATAPGVMQSGLAALSTGPGHGAATVGAPFTLSSTEDDGATTTTEPKENAHMTPTSTVTDLADLIPDADAWVNAALNDTTKFPHGINIMLTGRHGTGKTEAVKALCKRHGLTLLVFSGPTMDAYTDLVGLPVTRIGADGREVVVKIPPSGVLDAEVILIDEPNRAEPAVLNALFELLQSRTVNGRASNARLVFSCINPADDDSYHVGQLDAAFESRYHLRVKFTPNPIAEVIAERVDLPLAKAAVEWWNTSNHEKREAYISPRTLTALACAWSVVPTVDTLNRALPDGTVADTGRLHKLLEKARGVVSTKREDEALSSTTPEPATTTTEDDDKPAPVPVKPLSFRRKMMRSDEALDRLTKRIENGDGDRVQAGLDANSQPTWSRMCQDLLVHAMEHADGYDACVRRWLPVFDMLNGKFATPKLPIPSSVR